VTKVAKGKRRGGGNSNHDALPSKEQILEFINSSPGKTGKREIARAFNIRGGARIALKRLLREMADDGLIEGRRRRIRRPGQLPPVMVLEVSHMDEEGELAARYKSLGKALFAQLAALQVEDLREVVVLGGGTDSRINGESQLSTAGDRIATAARMYHAQRVERLICTGSNAFQGSPLDLPPREEAAEVLVDLGVPSDRVIQLEGKNTSEEMKNLHAWLDAHQDCRRVGLLTSAYHLPRAIRLALSRGLELVPVPSDFLTEPFAPSPHLVVPGTDHLNTTHRALKEYLAWWVGR